MGQFTPKYSVKASKIQIIGNLFKGINTILRAKDNGVLFTNNQISGATSRVIEFGGGGTIKDCIVTDNVISGVWASTLNINGANIPDAAIFAHGTTLSNCQFRNTIIDESATSQTAYYLPFTGTPCNTIDGKVTGFSTPYSVQNPTCNVYDANRFLNKNSNLSDIADKTLAQTNLGLSTAATQPKEAFMAASNGKLIATTTKSFTTTNWSTSSYTEIVAPSTLANNTIYLVKAYFSRPNTDECVQTWIVPISGTFSGSTSPASDLNSNYAVYGGATGRYLKMRLKTGGTTWGLEMALGTSDMAGSNGTIQVSVTPLF